MGIGFLKIDVSTGNDALPVARANVVIKNTNGATLFELTTDESGQTNQVELEAPDISHTLNPNDPGPYYNTYDVTVSAEGFSPVMINGVQIFDTAASILPVSMLPVVQTLARQTTSVEYDIPQNALQNQQPKASEAVPSPTPAPKILRNVIIPDYITVHLGSPSSPAKNVRVPFIDYIKNVASSEIFPTWPRAALESNILAQITFALNRIYTEWYTSRGYPFQITSSTAYDQSFVDGRNVFQNISTLVDSMFNMYVRRIGYKEPFFTQYCNGTTVTCEGLSQWGTVPLANQGMTPTEILKYYYPDDIEVTSSNAFVALYESYPGTPLQEGDASSDVKLMEDYLNRIRINYPLIPEIKDPNGTFGNDTTRAVTTFQQTFNLPPDGIIGKGTWYKISSIYAGVKKLSELESEGERIGIGATPPTSVLREGSKGGDVVELQYILNFIANFYSTVPAVIQNGSFDSRTTRSVVGFQREFGLTPDGVVGPTTWRKLYSVYKSIEESINNPVSIPTPTPTPPPSLPPYPGTPLRVGSSGPDVMLLQKYLNDISTIYTSIPQLVADGSFGNNTKLAVAAFQKQFGLTPDGVVGPTTWNKVMQEYESLKAIYRPYPGMPLRVGARGDDVLWLQNQLKTLSSVYPSIPNLTPDGVFGNGTAAAVAQFQKIAGLPPDGIAGKFTWNALIQSVNEISPYAVQTMGGAKQAAQPADMTQMMLMMMLMRRPPMMF